jgi:hypothetical protein
VTAMCCSAWRCSKNCAAIQSASALTGVSLEELHIL